MSRRPSTPPTSWRVYKISNRQKLLGIVYADSEEEAIEAAVKEFKVPEFERNRIVVRRED